MFFECVCWSECCGETQGPLWGWLRPLTAAVGEDEEVEVVCEREEVKGEGVLKNAGTDLVKYHPWTKAVATTVVLEDVGCMLFMPTDHLGNRAVHSWTHSLNNLSDWVVLVYLFNFQCWRWCVCLLPPSLAYVISQSVFNTVWLNVSDMFRTTLCALPSSFSKRTKKNSQRLR